MTIRERGETRSSSVLGPLAIISLVFLGGCVHVGETKQSVRPCIIHDVTIDVVKPENIDAVCDVLIGNDYNDDGHILAQEERTLGCANKKAHEIAVTANDKTMTHEIEHLLNWFCRDKAP